MDALPRVTHPMSGSLMDLGMGLEWPFWGSFRVQTF